MNGGFLRKKLLLALLAGGLALTIGSVQAAQGFKKKNLVQEEGAYVIGNNGECRPIIGVFSFGDDCSFCYVGLNEHDAVASLPCGHILHAGCADLLLQDTNRYIEGCPLCSGSIYDNPNKKETLLGKLELANVAQQPRAVAPPVNDDSDTEEDFSKPGKSGFFYDKPRAQQQRAKSPNDRHATDNSNDLDDLNNDPLRFAVEQPRAHPAVEQPRAHPAVEQPRAHPAVEQPNNRNSELHTHYLRNQKEVSLSEADIQALVLQAIADEKSIESVLADFRKGLTLQQEADSINDALIAQLLSEEP